MQVDAGPVDQDVEAFAAAGQPLVAAHEGRVAPLPARIKIVPVQGRAGRIEGGGLAVDSDPGRAQALAQGPHHLALVDEVAVVAEDVEDARRLHGTL